MNLYHGSKIGNLKVLRPFANGDDKALVYFFDKRENTLVYLCNAVERFCKKTNFPFHGKFATWGPYGFDSDGVLFWEEYYPNAFAETFKGGSGYIYKVDTEIATKYGSIPSAFVADVPVEVIDCEFVPDVYEEILLQEQQGKLHIRRFENMTEGHRMWLENTIRQQYANPNISADYRYFLENKFYFLKNEN